jgi:hypothetical protein
MNLREEFHSLIIALRNVWELLTMDFTLKLAVIKMFSGQNTSLMYKRLTKTLASP